MATLVSTGDVQDRLQRPLAGVELTAALVFVSEVSAMARLAVPGLDAAVTANADFATVVAGRLAGAVLRVLRNPDGKIQESIDDYAYRRADAVADGSLYLSDADLAALRALPDSTASIGKVGSQKLSAYGYRP